MLKQDCIPGRGFCGPLQAIAAMDPGLLFGFVKRLFDCKQLRPDSDRYAQTLLGNLTTEILPI
jgi:hypothetical protein